MPDNLSMPSSTIIPVLAYVDVPQAVSWLCAVFGFRERLRIGGHRSQLQAGDAAVVVTSGGSTTNAQETTHSIMVRVPSVDTHFANAQRSGAEIMSVPADYPYGERQYSVRDIGGHVWTFSETLANVDPRSWGGELFLE